MSTSRKTNDHCENRVGINQRQMSQVFQHSVQQERSCRPQCTARIILNFHSGSLFLANGTFECFFALMNWCNMLVQDPLSWTIIITNGTLEWHLALMNWGYMLSQATIFWKFALTNGTLKWFLSFMNWWKKFLKHILPFILNCSKRVF